MVNVRRDVQEGPESLGVASQNKWQAAITLNVRLGAPDRSMHMHRGDGDARGGAEC